MLLIVRSFVGMMNERNNDRVFFTHRSLIMFVHR